MILPSPISNEENNLFINTKHLETTKKMRKILLSVALMMASIALHATDANYRVVPLPQSITMQKGDAFVLDGTTSVLSLSTDEAMQRNVQFLKQYIRETTGISPEDTSKKGSVILLKLNDKIENAEGYVITVKTKNITIEGKTAAGVFYGIQTLRKRDTILGWNSLRSSSTC